MHKLLNLVLSACCLFALVFCHSTDATESEVLNDCSNLYTKDTSGLSQVLLPLNDSLRHKTGVYVLDDGGSAMMARAWLAEHAEKTIDIQYFIFATDNVGLIACDYLVRAADRGVKVRMLIDDILIDANPKDVLTLASHKNIEIRVYNPGINLGKNLVQKIGKFATDFHAANQRMHNKTFTVDSKVVISGGRNIADEYFDYDHAYNFRDRDVLLLGKVCGDVHTSFEQFWNSSLSVPVEQLVTGDSTVLLNPKRFNALHNYACDPDNFWPQVRTKIKKMPEYFQSVLQSGELQWLDSVKFVSDLPGKNTAVEDFTGGITTEALVNLIRGAKHSIEIQSPYLITTDVSRAILKAAASRGVKIRILTNSLASTDNLEAFSGYQRDRKALLATGIRVFEFKPDAKIRYELMTGELQKKMNYTPIFGLHAKSMVIDDHITVVGTFNFDPRSANYNTECVSVIYSNEIAKGVKKHMEQEFQSDNAWETTATSNPDWKSSETKRIQTKIRRVVPKGIL